MKILINFFLWYNIHENMLQLLIRNPLPRKYADSEKPRSKSELPRSACIPAQSDQGFQSPLTESLDTTECKNGLCTCAG